MSNQELYDLCEDGYLYHVTSATNAVHIRKTGLRAGSYWAGNLELVDYYIETVKDEGDEPVVFKLSVKYAPAFHPEVDHPSVAEPITSALDMTEEDVSALWSSSNGSWEDSLLIVGSVRLMETVPPELFSEDET